jgi:hypothetical protein
VKYSRVGRKTVNNQSISSARCWPNIGTSLFLCQRWYNVIPANNANRLFGNVGPMLGFRFRSKHSYCVGPMLIQHWNTINPKMLMVGKFYLVTLATIVPLSK